MDKFRERFYQLSDDLLNEVENSFKLWRYKKNTLVNKGSIADRLFFINEGFALLKIDFKGKQWVRHIAQPGEFITSFASFENGICSEETILAVGEFEIYYIERNDLQKLRNKFPEVDKIYTSGITSALIACQHRIEDLLCLDAEQYYEKLLNEKNAIMNNLPQYELASYLGIQPQSLSRIRGGTRRISSHM
ncbi:MAG: Crp/Fnr family transcriptional regulator [Thermonemataceae bacterium]|mgnify:CR=1 FL=1